MIHTIHNQQDNCTAIWCLTHKVYSMAYGHQLVVMELVGHYLSCARQRIAKAFQRFRGLTYMSESYAVSQGWSLLSRFYTSKALEIDRSVIPTKLRVCSSMAKILLMMVKPAAGPPTYDLCNCATRSVLAHGFTQCFSTPAIPLWPLVQKFVMSSLTPL